MPAGTEGAKAKPEISMRHSKLTAAEAAILTGELNKPSWESRNEGIHERVSFEDSIWGFDLAGGSFYKTPLRVTYVKPDSRAARAGIRAGDRLKRINDIDTSTLTIQEAHQIIIDSGVHLRLAVTAPDDEEDSYGCWEDQIEDGYDSEEERRKEEERAKKRVVHAKVSSYWSLQWPWVSKRRVIYRESNCFMVPSKYETKHRDNFPLEPNFGPKVLDDIVLQSTKSAAELSQDVDPVVNAVAELKNINEVEPNENLPQELKSESEKINEDNQNAAVELPKINEEAEQELDPLIDNTSLSNNADRQQETMNTQTAENLENSQDFQAAETEIANSMDDGNDEVDDEEEESLEQDDEVLSQVLKTSEGSKDEEEKIFNDILNDSDIQTDANAIDENKR